MLRGIGLLSIVWTALLSASASEVKFTAELDRLEIAQDESVQLIVKLEVDGSYQNLGELKYEAEDFIPMSVFPRSYTSSLYVNGKFSMKVNRETLITLRPKKTGSLTIKGVEITVDGTTYKAGNLVVTVVPPGAGTPPPKGYSSGNGLRGSTQRTSPYSAFFVRADINKAEVYKGEQVIVGYYLYYRTRIFSEEALQYPTLPGFLKEDLEMTVGNQAMPEETVTYQGVQYVRRLLARFAAYPLKEGDLTIDPMKIRANYFSMQEEDEDPNDPWAGFNMLRSPRSGTQSSEPIKVHVKPLPTEGQPKDFSGVVGSFDIDASLDKTETKAGEAVTLTLRALGRGNVSSLKEPQADWPAGIELYEAKGRSKTDKAGNTEKVFEYLLIPRAEGEFTLPKLEFSFFDPAKRTYRTASSQPLQLKVSGLAPGFSPAAPGQSSSKVTKPEGAEEPRDQGLSIPSALLKAIAGVGRWILVGAAIALAMGGLFALLRAAWLRRARERKIAREENPWLDLELPRENTRLAYERLRETLLLELEKRFQIPARAIGKKELREHLVEKKLPEPLWERIEKFVDYSALVCFSGISDENFLREAESRVGQWEVECRSIAEEVRKLKR